MVEISEVVDEKNEEVEKEVEVENVEDYNKLPPMMPINNGGITKDYVWRQTAYDVTVFISIADQTKTKDIEVKFFVNRLMVKIQGETKVDGELFLDIKIDTATWYIDREGTNCLLVIEMDKHKKQEWWKTIIKGHREILEDKVTPDTEYVGDLDSETRYTIDKMLYEQKIKQEKGLLPRD